MGPWAFFGPHVCTSRCDGPKGCVDARREEGRFTRVQKAREACQQCAVTRECLVFALLNKEKFGIFGGFTERERARMLKIIDETGVTVEQFVINMMKKGRVNGSNVSRAVLRGRPGRPFKAAPEEPKQRQRGGHR